MKELKDLLIGRNIKIRQNQKKQMTILQDFILMILFKELKDCLFLLLTILMTVKKTLKETVIEKKFFSRVNITNYNVLINGRKFYDQPINDQIKKYEEIRKVAT